MQTFDEGLVITSGVRKENSIHISPSLMSLPKRSLLWSTRNQSPALGNPFFEPLYKGQLFRAIDITLIVDTTCHDYLLVRPPVIRQ